MTFQIAIDIGGTFTDLYARSADGSTESVKVPTTPSNLTDGMFAALQEAADVHDRSMDDFLAHTNRFIHGTTVATNAIIENTVGTTGLICTDGFRDTLWLREEGKANPYKWDMDYPEPYIPRRLTIGVTERITPEGDIAIPLNEDDIRSAVRTLVDRDVEAIAVALLWAHSNAVHEERIGEIIEEEAPDLHYSLSSAVNPIIREYRRTSSTAIDASLHHLVSDYLRTLERKLDATGFAREPLIISANGGIMHTDELVRRPIWIVDSGPTMLPVAAKHYVATELGRNDVIALDMGGTSLDMGVVTDGTIPRTRDAEIGDEHMMGIEKVQVESIGSGGGSIAWVDDGGLLHVGPESAGAEPGPACYGRGGDRPTFTDACLVLGYLNEAYFLGGEMTLDRSRARGVIDGIADALQIEPLDAAYSIFGTTVQNMVNGIEQVTINRGIDPRKYVISGGGGALGLCVVPMARDLRVEDILLPREAGVVSSVGGLASEMRRDFSTSQFTTSEDFNHEAVNAELAELRRQAEEFFERASIPPDKRSLTYFTEARYPYQVWELEVQVPFSQVAEGEEDQLVKRFHDRHQQTYGFRTDEDVEFLYWRVEASGGSTGVGSREPSIDSAEGDTATPTTYNRREAYFEDHLREGNAYRSGDLTTGHVLEGPAFVDGPNTTIVLPPDSRLAITEGGNFHIEP